MRTKAQTFLRTGIAGWLLFCGSQLSIHGATLPTGFTEANWGNSIANNCTAMAFAPDGRLFVCQQNGSLRVIKDGTLLAAPFLTVTVNSSSERGLLGIAFDPNFSSNRFLYIYYTANTPTIHNRVSRFTAQVANPDLVQAGTEVPILDLETLSAGNHNGGAIHFGSDGKLYVAVGENAVMSNSQNLGNRLGKILRINSDGGIPADNPTTFPLVSGTGSTAPGPNRAIWAIGFRNPFTFGFKPGTTRLFINDVGGNPPGVNGNGPQEEINDGIAGKNYGWPDEEGPTSPPNANYTDPILFYGHGSGSTSTGCAIVGAAFYNPSVLQFPASYIGKYFYGDLCNGWIRYLDPSNNSSTLFATGLAGSLVDLHVGPDGALYYLVQGGQVTRVQATPSQALNISARARIETGDNVLIGGFIITGSGTKNVLIRGLGPSLPAFVPNRLADPFLELHGPAPGNALITSNNDWRVPVQNETAVQATGLAPSNNLEPAIAISLQPGVYTAIMSGNGGTSGSGLIEVYDRNPGAGSQLGNISARGFVQTGDNVLIGGFIIGNNIGASKVVVRALGPSLASAGISNPLANPTLELHDGNGALIRFNNNWQDDATQAAQITATGLQPSNSLESAIFAALAPGVYTAIVAGFNGGTGIGLVEVYKIP